MEQHKDHLHKARARASRWKVDDGGPQEQIQLMGVSLCLLTHGDCIVFRWTKPRNIIPHICEYLSHAHMDGHEIKNAAYSLSNPCPATLIQESYS